MDKYIFYNYNIEKSPLVLPGRIKNFYKNRLAVISLFILLCLYFLSFFSELIANDKPLLIHYNGKLYFFTAYFFYPDKTFGGKYNTEARYDVLAKTYKFSKKKDNFILYPPVPYNPYAADSGILKSSLPTPPDRKHILGTDKKGRDVFARLLYGFRNYMSFAVILLIIEVFIGIFIGVLQGYFGVITKLTVCGFVKVLSALPFLYIILLVVNIYGRGFTTLVIVMSVFNWIGLSLYMRNKFNNIKEYRFIDAARILNTGKIRIFFTGILPNTFFPVICFAPFSLIAALKMITGLDYLGFGLEETIPGWGDLIRQGMELKSSYWLLVYPTVFLIVTLLLLSFIGYGLRQVMEPENYPRME